MHGRQPLAVARCADEGSWHAERTLRMHEQPWSGLLVKEREAALKDGLGFHLLMMRVGWRVVHECTEGGLGARLSRPHAGQPYGVPPYERAPPRDGSASPAGWVDGTGGGTQPLPDSSGAQRLGIWRQHQHSRAPAQGGGGAGVDARSDERHAGSDKGKWGLAAHETRRCCGSQAANEALV